MKKIVILALVVAALVGSFGSALASGYPFLVLAEGNESGTATIAILGKFHEGAGQFTFDEANTLVTSVIAGVTNLLGTPAAVPVLTPRQMTDLGYGNADNDKAFLKSAYKSAGIEFLVFVDIKKIGEYAPGFGQNMRVDVYIVDLATLIGPPLPPGDLYVASIELPYVYVSLLNSPK
jgi:hypothetical protein